MFTDIIDLFKPEGCKIKLFNDHLSKYILAYLDKEGFINFKDIEFPIPGKSMIHKTYALGFDNWDHLNYIIEFFCTSLAFNLRKEMHLGLIKKNNLIKWRKYPSLEFDKEENKFYIICRCRIDYKDNHDALNPNTTEIFKDNSKEDYTKDYAPGLRIKYIQVA